MDVKGLIVQSSVKGYLVGECVCVCVRAQGWVGVGV